MKVKKVKDFNHLSRLIRSIAGKKNVFLFSSFIAYNALLIIAALAIYHTKIPFRYRQKINDRIALEKIPVNFVKGKTAVPEKFQIDIKHKHLRKLAYVRAVSLERGVLYDWDQNNVPATIRYQGKAYQVRLSVKGRLEDHWKDEDMVSLKVKVTNDKTIDGMRTFALQHPKTRFYINEWILHQLFNYAGLISLRYDFVAVDINGKGSRIYALEEGLEKRLIENNQLKEGAIFKFNRDFYWDGGDLGGTNKFGLAQDIWGSEIVPASKKRTYADSLRMLNFNKAKSLIQAFRENKLKPSDVFDLPKLGTYFALIDLIGYAHPSTLDNIRFYYNPITSLIEPIIHDSGSFFRLQTRERHPTKRTNNGMVGTERQIGPQAVHNLPWSWKSIAWFGEVFKDPIFFREYVKALEKVSSKSFLDVFMEENRTQFLKKRSILHQDFPLFDFNPIPILYQNQQYIQATLKPKKLVHAYFNKAKSSENVLQIDLTNIQNLPVEILGARLADSIDLRISGTAKILQANIQATPVAVQGMHFILPDNLHWEDRMMEHLKIQASILGSGQVMEDSVVAHQIIESDTWSEHILKRQPNAEEFEFIRIDESGKCIYFLEGSHELNRNLTIPPGYRVLAKGGTKINMVKGADLVSFSPLFLVGSEDYPILFSSSDSSAQGIKVIEAQAESRLQHVHFNHISGPRLGSSSSQASIVFFQSPVRFDHCFFGNNHRTDTHLSIVESNYSIDHSLFYNSDGNALKGRFSEGSIKNTRIIHSQQDAIALIGSKMNLEDIWIENAGRVGIKISEKSTLDGRQITIRNTGTAVSSQDLSKALVSAISIQDSRIAFAAFQCQPNFGPAAIEIESNTKISGQVEAKYVVGDQSKLILAEKEIKPRISPSKMKQLLSELK